MLSKYLNIAQIYIDQQAFLVESNGTDLRKVVNSVNGILDKRSGNTTVNRIVKSCLKDDFKKALSYVDTKRDRDVMQANIGKRTSLNTVVSLKETQFKGSVRGNLASFRTNLNKYKDVKLKGLTVRNDMTVDQQHAHVKRNTSKLKKDGVEIIAKGRGRKLKSEEFPELARIG